MQAQPFEGLPASSFLKSFLVLSFQCLSCGGFDGIDRIR